MGIIKTIAFCERVLFFPNRVSNLIVNVNNQLITHFARKQLIANFQQSINCLEYDVVLNKRVSIFLCHVCSIILIRLCSALKFESVFCF